MSLSPSRRDPLRLFRKPGQQPSKGPQIQIALKNGNRSNICIDNSKRLRRERPKNPKKLSSVFLILFSSCEAGPAGTTHKPLLQYGNYELYGSKLVCHMAIHLDVKTNALWPTVTLLHELSPARSNMETKRQHPQDLITPRQPHSFSTGKTHGGLFTAHRKSCASNGQSLLFAPKKGGAWA